MEICTVKCFPAGFDPPHFSPLRIPGPHKSSVYYAPFQSFFNTYEANMNIYYFSVFLDKS